MNDLRRELAPLSAQAWAAIEDEAKNTLKPSLAGRKLVDFAGPLGWEASAVNLGRVEALSEAPGASVSAALRQVRPLVELRVPFTLALAEIDNIARGAKDADLKPVTEAASAIARAEDKAIFEGFAPAGIVGLCQAAGAALAIPDSYEDYPDVVAAALARLRLAGIGGPYGIALGPRCFTGLTQTTKGGFPVLQHVQRMLDGPIVWAPAVDGAAVLSLRGGDFELTVGRDLSIGYRRHDADAVELYLVESFTFRVLGAEAAVPLRYGLGGAA